MNKNAKLFSPLKLRNVTLPNRVVLSPLCMYSANSGVASNWQFAHLSTFARGGVGLVFAEATAVEPKGRITPRCLGIWTDEQVEALKPTTEFITSMGSVPGIQIAHAGRKASASPPWDGGKPLKVGDSTWGDPSWEVMGPSAVPLADGWQTPQAMSEDDISTTINNFASSADRAVEAGFKVLEIHGAHGYLIHSFLSPLSKQRNDKYGGDLAGRMRLAIEVSGAVRRAIPDHMPLFFRISAVDNIEGGWQLEDTLSLAGELAKLGVDVLDCSSSGIAGAATAAAGKRQPGFQVPYAEAVRANTNLMSMAVGLITHPEQANNIIQTGQADLVAVAREALFNPMWAAQAARYLGMDDRFNSWPEQSGWWLERREKSSEFYAPESQNAKEGF